MNDTETSDSPFPNSSKPAPEKYDDDLDATTDGVTHAWKIPSSRETHFTNIDSN